MQVFGSTASQQVPSEHPVKILKILNVFTHHYNGD